MNALKTLRIEACMSQRRFGAACGFGRKSQARIGHYEAGRRSPSLDDARTVVATLNRLGVECDMDDVFPPSVVTRCAS